VLGLQQAARGLTRSELKVALFLFAERKFMRAAEPSLRAPPAAALALFLDRDLPRGEAVLQTACARTGGAALRPEVWRARHLYTRGVDLWAARRWTMLVELFGALSSGLALRRAVGRGSPRTAGAGRVAADGAREGVPATTSRVSQRMLHEARVGEAAWMAFFVDGCGFRARTAGELRLLFRHSRLLDAAETDATNHGLRARLAFPDFLESVVRACAAEGAGRPPKEGEAPARMPEVLLRVERVWRGMVAPAVAAMRGLGR
jgi:hypothetical protein